MRQAETADERPRLDALILCGGLGTRLRPALGDLPKALAPVGGRPFLERLLERLAAEGLERFILCTGWRSDAIDAVLPGLARYGEVVTSREEKPLGTGGALRNARALVRSDPVFVLNGDSFSNVGLVGMLREHRARGAAVTIAVVPAHGHEGGIVRLGEGGRILSFAEKAEPGQRSFCSAGLYLLSRALLFEAALSDEFSLESDLFPRLVGRGAYGHVHDGSFLDIGTPRRYRAAPRLLDAIIEAGRTEPKP
jgi:NDP-sugar pyrophosphorylase family protein